MRATRVAIERERAAWERYVAACARAMRDQKCPSGYIQPTAETSIAFTAWRAMRAARAA